MKLRHRRLITLLFGVLTVAGCSAIPARPVADDPAPGHLPGTWAVTGSFAPPTLKARIELAALDESSGLAASRRRPGLLWTHNDSGDEPLLYCVDPAGRPCGVWVVTGASARDWEDMAAGPGPEPGQSYLYLGDIGDNNKRERSVTVYRVPEPDPDGGSSRQPKATAAATALVLRYSDGPHDAEALLVHPATGDIYVVTKDFDGGGVYRASGDRLDLVATVDLGEAQAVTGGDISPDGRRVALSSLLGGFELTRPDGAGDFDSIWKQTPTLLDLGRRQQGESVAYRLDGEALFATSEGSPMPLYEVVRRPT